MSKLSRLLPFVFMMVIFSVKLFGQGIDLKLKLKKGDVFTIETTTDQLIQQDVMGQKQEQTQVTTFINRYEVTESQDDLYTMKVTYTDVYVSMKTPMGDMEYDSKNPPADISPALQGFAGLKGSYFTMQLNHKGEVKKVEGVDEMLDKMINNMDIPSDDMRAGIKENMKTQFGDEALKSSMERSMAIYPDKSVKKGDSWKKNTSMSMGMYADIENTYTLTSIEGNKANVKVASVVSSMEDNKGMEIGGMKIFYEVGGKQVGVIELDIQSGLTRSSSIDQDLSGTVRLEGNPQLPDGTTWPISIKSKISTKMIE